MDANDSWDIPTPTHLQDFFKYILLQLADYGEYIFVCFYPSAVLDFPEDCFKLLLVRDENIFTWPHVAQGYKGFLGNTHD